jgi:radical SAM superfamily enzyme YgiQ (UPF0313 family)
MLIKDIDRYILTRPDVRESLEYNVVRKNPLRVSSRIAFIYPSLYDVMLSSLAVDMIYFLVNEIEDVYLERFHVRSLKGYEKDPRSLETRSPLKDFDLYISSIHYEPDIVNLVNLLESGGIHPLRRERKKILILGGPGVMANPIPFEDIADVFVIGEIENTMKEIIELFLEYKDDKKRFLEKISDLPYVYVPEYTEGFVKRSYVKDLDESFYPIRQIENIEIEPVYGRGFKLEISRGCKHWCSFCFESRLFQPYRERSLQRLKEIVEKGSRYTLGGKRIIIYSLLMPASIDQIRFLEYLVENGYKASIPSLRINDLFLNTDFLDLVSLLGQRTIVTAPETFSLKIQKTYFKYIEPETHLLSKLMYIIDKGFDLKIYMIYGAKWEKMEDIKTSIDAIKKIARYSKERGRSLSVSLNPLMPRPKTLFQWIGMRELDQLKNILRIFREELGGIIDLRPLDLEWSLIQTSISLSPRPLGELIIEWSREGRGASSWIRILKRHNIDLRYVFEGYKYGDVLPWDRIIIGENVEEVAKKQYETLNMILSR